jgi:hypothetical protein
MPFDHLAPRLQGGVIQRVRQLAQAAAGRWNQTTLLQHAAGDKAAPPIRAADLRGRFARPICFQKLKTAPDGTATPFSAAAARRKFCTLPS